MGDETVSIMDRLQSELGEQGRIEQPPASPVQAVGTRKRAPAARRVRPTKAAKPAAVESLMEVTEQEDDIETEAPPRKKTAMKSNSDLYPKEDRPPMFEDDEAFDRLSVDKAAEIVLQFYAIKEKKAMKNTVKSTLEKTDDKL